MYNDDCRRWVFGALAGVVLCASVVQGAEPKGKAVDALAFYNADASAVAAIGKRIANAKRVELDRVELHGWWKLIREPSKQPGTLTDLAKAGPAGFSRADHDAAVLVRARKRGVKQGRVCGTLEPGGLAFDHPVKLVRKRYLRIPVPATVLASGEYKLTLCVTAGGRSEAATVPITIGPYLHYDRYHAYSWQSGQGSAKGLLAQIRRAKRLGLSMVDQSYLPGTEALRAGLLVSAHEVTVHQNQVKGTAATPANMKLAKAKGEAIGHLANRFSHIRWCLTNSEYGAGYLMPDPAFDRMMATDADVKPDRLRFRRPNVTKGKKPPLRYRAVLDKRVRPLAPGVYRHTLPEIRAARYARREGCGWYRLNRLYAETIRRIAPQVRIWTEPTYHVEQFDQTDVVGFWEYSTNPYRLLHATKRADCIRRQVNAREVYVCVSQWFLDVRGPAVNGKRPPVMRAPDHHRFYAWLIAAEPTHTMGYWALKETDKHPDCAKGIARAMREVAYPYGTLLRGTTVSPPPVAVYLSTVGEFLGRVDRPSNYWFRHHYLNGVMPGLLQRFKNRLVLLDDGDILAGRHKPFPVMICPIFRATTDQLRKALRQYQKAGGTLVGDGLWRVHGLVPNDTFPGKSPQQRKISYSNKTLARWQGANRDEILQWSPKGWDKRVGRLALDTPTSDVILSLRQSDDVLYAVAVNAKMRQGAWARKFGITDPRYRDTGVAQPAEVLVKAGTSAAVYDAIAGRRLTPDQFSREGERVRIRATLPAAGAGLWVVRPRAIARVVLDAGTTDSVRAGTCLMVVARVLDDRGQPVTGQTVVTLTVTDAAGKTQDVSGWFPARSGTVRIPVGIGVGAKPGTWTIQARDITSGLIGKLTVPVVAR